MTRPFDQLVHPLLAALLAATSLIGPAALAARPAAPDEELGASDQLNLAKQASARGDNAEALSRYVRVLADEPRDLAALIGAGNAAVELGDYPAGLAFFGRAEEIDPSNGRVKAGLASALTQTEQPGAALRLFDEAVALGVPEAEIAGDRGLAWDLRGNSRRAQRDYAIALAAKPGDHELSMRLALSQAISGDRDTALRTLQPWFAKRDQGAWRTRAFILAMTGDTKGASAAAAAVLPSAQASAMAPFFARLASLNPAQKAMAANFGYLPGQQPRPGRPSLPTSVALTAAGGPAQPRPAAPSSPTVAMKPVAHMPASTPAKAAVVAATPLPAAAATPVPTGVAIAAPAPAASAAPVAAGRASATIVTSAPAAAAPTPVVSPVSPVPLPPSPTASPTQLAMADRPTADLAALREQTAVNAETEPDAGEKAETSTKPIAAYPVGASHDIIRAPLAKSATAAATHAPQRKTASQAIPEEIARRFAALPHGSASSAEGTSDAVLGTTKGSARPAAGKTILASADLAAKTKPRDGADERDTVAEDKKAGLTDMKETEAKDDAGATTNTKKKTGKIEELVDADKPVRKATTDSKGKADKTDKAESSAKGDASRYWVQVAGGADKDDLGKAWAKLKAGRAGHLLKGHSPSTTPLRFTNRLLVGPFHDNDAAQAFVNKLAGVGTSAFTFKSAEGQKIDKLPSP